MMMMRRRLACCAHNRNISLDFDEQEMIMTYNGLESCIMNQYDNESRSRRDECATDSLDDDDSSCSSSKDGFGSFSSKWFAMKRDERGLEEWELSDSPRRFYAKDKKENPSYGILFSDVDAMKEKFAKLLLGEDVTGGCKGVSTALALSNSITNVAATVFGELWKLEPLPEERKSKWRIEMDWFLSPTKYMVELVPTKQNGANGRMIEIMTPKVRADIHINLPALQKLDSLLIETLDSMVSTEFWYAEGGKSTHQSKRWWLPMPQVPEAGLSDSARKKLLNQGLLVHQVFKAARSINESVLLDMPVPTIIRDALPKSGKANLNEELYKILTKRSSSTEEVLKLLNIKSEHDALYVINRLEAAVFSWKERITEYATAKSPIRTSWSSFVKDPLTELDRAELLSERAEFLVQQLKTRFPNLPQTFLDATKVQYGKDVGHSILEAYSRVLGNLAFTILSRIGDILREDALSDSSSPVSTCLFPGIYGTKIMETPKAGLHEPVNQKNGVDSRRCDSTSSSTTDLEFSCNAGKASPVTATPSRGRVWCIGREACVSASAENSP